MKQLWYGGTIYTMEKESETVEAILVENDKIIAVGSVADLKNQANKKIDLQGAAMYPGFVDSHLHMLFQGEKLTRLDLSKVTSAHDMLDRIKEAALTTPEGKWLFGEGWNENNFADRRIPTRQELDAIRKEPIVLTRICHHVMLGNSAALEAGGVTGETQSPAGGEIGRDAEQKLNGLLFDNAMNSVIAAIPRDGEAYIQELVNQLNLCVDDMLSKGLTGGHTEDLHYFGHFSNPLSAFLRTVGEKHHFRVHLLRHNVIFKGIIEANLPVNQPFIEWGAMKIFTDGALGASTAALSEPYSDNPNNRGLLIQTDEELEELVELARSFNEAVAVHIIGDRGAEQIISLLEKYPVPSGKRDRLIHACVLREDLVEKIANLPVVVDIQPLFVPSDFPWVINRLGEDRLDYAYAWKTLLDKGIMCASGTDAPVEEIDPIATIYAAVERKKPGEDHDGYLPQQKLSRYEAIRAYTVGSAQAICKEYERGLIKPGYDADFSIFDRDLFKGTSEEMLEAKAVKTVVAGKIVFEQV